MLSPINSNISFGCRLPMKEVILLGSGRKEAGQVIAKITGDMNIAKEESSLIRSTVADMMQNTLPKLSAYFTEARMAPCRILPAIIFKAERAAGDVLDISTESVNNSVNWAKDAIIND